MKPPSEEMDFLDAPKGVTIYLMGLTDEAPSASLIITNWTEAHRPSQGNLDGTSTRGLPAHEGIFKKVFIQQLSSI